MVIGGARAVVGFFTICSMISRYSLFCSLHTWETLFGIIRLLVLVWLCLVLLPLGLLSVALVLSFLKVGEVKVCSMVFGDSSVFGMIFY